MRAARPRVRPARLRKGDRVAVVAPSGPVNPDALDQGCRTLESLGLNVTVMPHVRDRNGFLAGTDPDRAVDFQRAWCDPSVRAVLCARGGYGATRMLEQLDWTAMMATPPKLLHGSSDVTALHAAVGTRLGVATTFGPMVAGRISDDGDRVSLDHFRTTLFCPEEVTIIEEPKAQALVPGAAAGMLTGGTLSLITALVGTDFAATPPPGSIALLEDVTEAPYRVDRMLTQLIQSGWFDGVTGIVTGSWVECGEPDDVLTVLRERLGRLGVPVLAGMPFGHGTTQLTVPFGVEACLDAERRHIVLDAPALA